MAVFGSVYGVGLSGWLREWIATCDSELCSLSKQAFRF